MATNESTPYREPGRTITGHATVAITGCRFVTLSGGRTDGNPNIAYPSAGGVAVGVTAYSVAAGEKVTIWRGHGIVHQAQAGANIAAGDPVKVNATGQVVPQAGSGAIIGIAWEAIASGATGPIDTNVYGS